MKHSEVLSRYVNTGERLPKEQYDRLTPVLKKSYLRTRGVAGYESWEFQVINDNQRINFIENKGEDLEFYEIKYTLQYSDNKDDMISKIFEKKGKTLTYNEASLLLNNSNNKYEISIRIIETLDQIDDDMISILLSYVPNSINQENLLSKIIENNKKMVDMDEEKIIFFIRHSQNADDIALKIIQLIDKQYFNKHNIKYLFIYPENKELIKKLLLQKGIDYELINKVITQYNFEKDGVSHIELIPDNYQSMLNEIRRIKEIMI